MIKSDTGFIRVPHQASHVALEVKNLLANAGAAGDVGSIPGLGRSIPWRRKWQLAPVFFVWEIPWTEEPGGLQSLGLQRVRYNSVTKHSV